MYGCVGVCLAVCGSVSFAAPVMGFLGVVGVACVGVWVFASSVCFFRGAARLAAFVLVTHRRSGDWHTLVSCKLPIVNPFIL